MTTSDPLDARAGTEPTRPVRPPIAWEAVVTVDRGRFEQQSATEAVRFPTGRAPRCFALDRERIDIGRTSETKGIHPTIDLSGDLADDAVSREHAALVKGDDGSYSIVDLGSSNGTYLNDDPTPLTANDRTELANGDRVGLGYWTIIHINRRPDQQHVVENTAGQSTGTERIDHSS